MKTFKDVDAYLAALRPEYRAALQRLRTVVLSAMPKGTEETISYGMPAYRHGPGRPVVYFAAFRNHLSLYPGSTGISKTFAKELRGFDAKAGTIRFTIEKQLPATLVKKIVKARLTERDRAAKKART